MPIPASVRRYASERDFVASYLLPRLKEASHLLGVSDIVDFHVEKPINGTPDLIAEKPGKRLFLIEAKFKKKAGKIERDIEPRDPDVIIQAVNYAGLGGFPFYATCNSKRLILFQHRPDVKAFESEVASFDYERNPDWAENVLKTVLELIPVKLKKPDDTLVETLHEAFNDFYPEFQFALKEKLRDKKFREKYTEWLESQGIEFSDENNRLIAEQSTYLQINKLLFYQVIRVIYPHRLSPLKIEEEEDVADALNRFFTEARKIDYAPIYESDIISEIPLTNRAKERFRTLLDTLNDFDFSKMERDFIGHVYEKLIPPLERKRLGQFYTPPGIVDFITSLTVTNPDALVLDPGCGSGSFLVRAYHKLRELNKVPKIIEGPLGEKFHQQLLERIYGIDINQFPAHLSVISLAIQNPKAKIEKLNVIVSDFFDIKPAQATLTGFQSITTEGKQTLIELPSAFDTVVANPPYIRQELLGEKEKKKIKELIEGEHKDKLFIGAPQKKVSSATILDKQSDIYIYFFIHGIRLLKKNGKLGFISSNKWLEVEYGEPFQQFLLDNTKILYVVEFDRAIFPDAEVNTAVTILEKEADKAKRQNNTVKFVRLKQKMDLETQLKLIEEANEGVEDERIRINLIRQSELTPGKWNIYLRAPPVYSKIIKNPKIKPLNKIGDVFFGLKTGYNPFFVLSNDDVKAREIEGAFLKPILYSPKDLSNLVVRKEDIKHYVFTAYRSRSSLRGTNAFKYIEHGEKLKVEVSRGFERKPRYVPSLESVKGHKPFWYSLPKLETPHILLPKLADKRMIAILNYASVLGSDLFYYIVLRKIRNVKSLFGFLNSSAGAMLGELYGRSYGGGVLDIKVYEAKQMPVLDPTELDETQRIAIEEAVDKLIDAIDSRYKVEEEFKKVKSRTRKDVGLFEAEAKKKLDEALRAEKEAYRKLDEAVYDALELNQKERQQVERGLKELQELRRLRTLV